MKSPYKIKEQDIVNAILEECFWRKIPTIHVRNTGVVFRKEGNIFFGKNKFAQKGAPDLVLCYRGKYIAVEVKSETGRLSPEQIEFLGRIGIHGGLTIVTSNPDDVFKFLEKL